MTAGTRNTTVAGVIVVTSLVAFTGAGWMLERSDAFAPIKERLRRDSLLSDAGTANGSRILRQLGIGRGVLEVLPVAPEGMLSSLAVDSASLADPSPLLSLVADEDDLYGEESGIVVNRRARGPESERLAQVSYYEEGELLFATHAGVRIHGDSTRFVGEPSFRLYFRDLYGASRFRPSIFFSPEAPAEPRIIVRRIQPVGLYATLFAFEIGQRVGAEVPRFKLARFLLNGKGHGHHLLVEHVHEEVWGRARFDDFYMYTYKTWEDDSPSTKAYERLHRWANRRSQITLNQAARRIDTDNLSRHLFTVMFCGTSDWAQGAAVLDLSENEPRWFWVHWDMDASFHWVAHHAEPPWEQPAVNLIAWQGDIEELRLLNITGGPLATRKEGTDVRRMVFTHLMRDPAYRDYFVRLVTDLLNHVIDPQFLDSLVDRYSYLADRNGRFGPVDMREFFARRPDFLRRDLDRYYGVGESFEVEVRAPEGLNFEIDGYPEEAGYSGWYFRGQSIAAELEGTREDAPAHWLVNGERIEGPRLAHRVTEKTVIEPAWPERR